MKAFPKQCDETIHEKGTKTVIETSQDGMDLRDYFAAQAMQAMIANHYLEKEYACSQAYKFADAMMEARSK